MSAWMAMEYAFHKVEKGEWTKEQAREYIEFYVQADLRADEMEREMIEACKKKLQELKN